MKAEGLGGVVVRELEGDGGTLTAAVDAGLRQGEPDGVRGGVAADLPGPSGCRSAGSRLRR